jgi:hypothetical protein
MVIAEDEADRRAALDELLPLQQADFGGLFEAMTGFRSRPPAGPPLHEFLPDRDELVEQIAEARLRDTPELGELERVRSLREGSPMLGTRGVRLGLFHPEIYAMQVRASFRATGGGAPAHLFAPPHLEIVSPTWTTLRGLRSPGRGANGCPRVPGLASWEVPEIRRHPCPSGLASTALAAPVARPSAPPMRVAPRSSGPASTT